MRFETVATGRAEGAILVHGLRAGIRVFKKGRTLSKDDIAELARAGIAEVTIVRLEAGDIGEDAAAARIASVLAGPGTRVGAAFTGRANLYAEQSGLAVFDPSAIDNANLTHDALTVATLSPFAMVAPGDMIATVKVIPFAAPETAIDSVTAILASHPVSVAPFRPMKAALIITEIQGRKAALNEKTRAAMAGRLAPLGSSLIFEEICAHDAGAVKDALGRGAKAGAEMFFVLGASAISDSRDVVPSGIAAAGAEIVHFGMPVDPGNLLLLAHWNGKPVVGLPGCARSPKINGLDFVLRRLSAGLEVTREDIMRMGVGGLLKEIPERPQPRREHTLAQARRAERVAAIVLAAGLSSRMGRNKLLADVGGVALVRRAAEAALASQARPVIVVTGHESAKVEAALAGLDIAFVHNPRYAEGLSTSLAAGLRAVPEDCTGALVMLGDMPEIDPPLIARMIAAFSPEDGRAICVATAAGKRGNPVLWAKNYFAEIESIAGDIGAKHLIGENAEFVCEVEADAGALRDVDTPEALEALLAHAQPVTAK